jgi:hypothetical protein
MLAATVSQLESCGNQPEFAHHTLKVFRTQSPPRYSPPVHMIRLTKAREIAPYAWVHPSDDDRR